MAWFQLLHGPLLSHIFDTCLITLDVTTQYCTAISHLLLVMSSEAADLDRCLSYALQQSAIESVYRGKDIFVWLPTGFGKSICYQTLPVDLQFCLSIYAVSLYC